MDGNSKPTIWTVGHSTRSAEAFVDLLRGHQIATLCDVRSFPGSWRFPHFNRIPLVEILLQAGMAYHHLPRLGGRRRPSVQSHNLAWQNSAFRAYADYMETPEFVQGIGELLNFARRERTVIMCAEALWWRCHRALIADYLKFADFRVVHLRDAAHYEEHPYTSAANVSGGSLTYKGLIG
jgi:uncharacterized protein (DUF488 family)